MDERPQRDEDLDAYVGLGADDAERRARERGWTEVRRLEPGSVVTMEYREGRLNLTVEDGRVTGCRAG
ncbi:proteinase inhibitor I78 [Actinomadura logoneensis]|uniref:Proteinase inhibitor I78 n=1 Tax=Actinomadura logoneensis TaxID=2293572 RepID=A0A372JD49_9ACTN|nr:I78 family peptidase inhibitor [Actinomadura logoneensis]RFU37890.1 proteinase inhibitor I78 [Actinomadura logoneensis]